MEYINFVGSGGGKAIRNVVVEEGKNIRNEVVVVVVVKGIQFELW